MCFAGSDVVDRSYVDGAEKQTVILNDDFTDITEITRIEFFAEPKSQPSYLSFGVYEKVNEESGESHFNYILDYVLVYYTCDSVPMNKISIILCVQNHPRIS